MGDRHIECWMPDAPQVRAVAVVREASLEALMTRLPPAQAAFLKDAGFTAACGEICLLPGEAGVAGAVFGLGNSRDAAEFGALADRLPHGAWRVDRTALGPDEMSAADVVLGFCLGAYRFDPFRSKPSEKPRAVLVEPETPDVRAVLATVRAVWLARDLINTPPNRLGPAELAQAAKHAVADFNSSVQIVVGDELVRDYPTVAAVAAGSIRPGCVVRIAWRGSGADDAAPLIALCGKGVCFDTGGYDLKPSAAMLRMKKDMGGAAVILGLATRIMAEDLPVRLEVWLGCVENSVSGGAMRPSDIITTRRGLTVEIGNTDAEGRLVLCDLLAEASDMKPDLLLDAATLTGAARVALGPELPALFCNDDEWASALLESGSAAHDPLWRLPLWPGYRDWLENQTADLSNVASKPFAGAIVAALFLERFVAPRIRWAHLDVYCWRDQKRSGRPEGGEAHGLRAAFGAVLKMLHRKESVRLTQVT